MTPTPSLRRMWTMYKKLLAEDGFGRRDQVPAQGAFYPSFRQRPNEQLRTILCVHKSMRC